MSSNKSKLNLNPSVYGWLGFPVIFFVLWWIVIPVHAQSDKTVITDIENNPVAQDILDKIEETKRWIVQLEEKQTNLLLESNELEEKRTQAKASLENDLKAWEELWSEYSSENMFARFVDTIPSNSTKAIFWDHYDFTQSKVQAGRDAFSEITNSGGDFQEAYAAYLKAAEITKIEMIQVNSMYNVMHGLAYYNQQILFNSDGKFDLGLSGEQLRKYYADFRTNPQYLLANPQDDAARNEFGVSDPDTDCRIGYVLIHRINEDDFVCVTERTAEMWQRYDLGSPVEKNILSTADILNVQQMNYDRIQEKVSNVNSKIQRMQETHEIKNNEMDKKHDLMVMNMEVQKKNEIKKVLANLSADNMSAKNFSDQVEDIRAKYDELEKTMIKEKFQILEIMEKSYERELDLFVDNYDDDPEMNVTWNSDRRLYQVVMAS